MNKLLKMQQPYEKICDGCGKKQVYNDYSNWKRALKNGNLCSSCSKSKEIILKLYSKRNNKKG